MDSISPQDEQSFAFQSTGSVFDLAVALRDFFLARNGEDLAGALKKLPGGDLLRETDLTGLEYEFNRLFIGPQAPLAPPYASVYLEREPRLMGNAAHDMALFYRALGLRVCLRGMPADFLGLELEAWLALESLIAEGESAELIRATQYLRAHMQSWLPLFTARMRACPLSAPMAKIVKLTDEWLQAEKDLT